MRQQFLNGADDVQWLRDTHLKGLPALPAFQSFVIIGNEDAPDELHLYASADPLYTDRFTRVDFTGGAPFYCAITPDCEGGKQWN